MRAIREVALTALALLGVLCAVLAIGGWLFGYSLIMFKTGSMAPTIPAGAVALVHEVPASTVRVGDVITVDRPGQLPVTHRVTSIEPAGSVEARTITLRGDANQSDDPAPYTVEQVRAVVGSVPGLARVIVWFGSPWVLGALTLAASLLIGWAFWPRDGDRRGVRGTAALLVVGGAFALSGGALAAGAGSVEAAWADREFAKTTATSGSLAAPTIVGCSVTNFLVVFRSVTVRWSSPIAQSPAFSIAILPAGSSTPVPVTSPTITAHGSGAQGYEYSWEATSGLLSTILGSLLGSSQQILVSANQEGWVSAPDSATLETGILGLGGRCTS